MTSNNSRMKHPNLGRRAIVVGGSIGGLLAARVLSDFFDDVVVFEKDPPEESMEAPFKPRKSVPQGHHLHILLSGGEAVLSRLFPGIDRELVKRGAIKADFGRDIRWYLNSRWFPRFDSGLVVFLQSRPLLETVIRRRVARIANIRMAYGHRVCDYCFTPQSNMVDGVLLIDKFEGKTAHHADFIVDATGRGSLLPKWLEKKGYGAPKETLVGIDLAYSTTFFHRGTEPHTGAAMTACHPDPPNELRGGVAIAVEDDRWQVTLAGYHGDHPPTDENGFKEYAAGLPIPQIYEMIRPLKPVEPIRRYHFPASMRRHFERMSRLPDHIIAIGDAMCSLNPAFGQGITGCALEAALLHKELSCAAERRASLTGLARRYFKGAAKIIDEPWELSAGENFKYPATTGKRSLFLPLMQWYRDRILSSSDPAVIYQFYRVMHLMDSRYSFWSPRLMTRVLMSQPDSSAPTLEPVFDEALERFRT